MSSGYGLRRVTSHPRKSALVVLVAATGAAIMCDVHPSLPDVQQGRSGHDAPASVLEQTERRDSYGGALNECWATAKARIDITPCLRKKLADAERDYEKTATRLAAKLTQLDAITEAVTAPRAP
jgi:hypothetical protein